MSRSPGTSSAACAISLLIVCGAATVVHSQGEEPATEPAAATTEAPEAAASTPARRGGRPLLPGSTAPPRNLKKVGDHWTPYDPPDPESFPPDATLHIIVPGDTLWDLADFAFGNPYLWPQIWNENRYILDSHWIYPGDPLLLPPRPTVVSEIVPQGQDGAPPSAELPPSPAPEPIQDAPAAEEPDEGAAPAATETKRAPETAHAPRHVPKVVPLADEIDIRCSGYIARKDTDPDYFIANQDEPAKIGLTEGDIIYLNRGKENGHVDPGTEYSIVVREGEVRHPVRGGALGVYYKRLGTVTVIAAQDYMALGIISLACDEIRTGYDLVSLSVSTLPAHVPPPFSRLETVDPSKPSGYVVRNADNMERVGTGYLVDIDLGYDDGIKPGDFLKLYLPTEPHDKYRVLSYDYEWENRRFTTPKLRRDNRHVPPPRVIGQLVVLTTEKHTATAKIIYSIREVEVGTQVELY